MFKVYIGLKMNWWRYVTVGLVISAMLLGGVLYPVVGNAENTDQLSETVPDSDKAVSVESVELSVDSPVGSASDVTLVTELSADGPAVSLGGSFAKQKQAVIDKINADIAALDDAMNQIRQDENIGARTKQVALDALAGVRAEMVAHRERVSVAINNAGVLASSLQYLGYMTANLSVIGDVINAVLLDLAEQFSVTVRELQVKLEPYIMPLRLVCPNQSQQIDQIATALGDVDVALTRLDVAIAREDLASVGNEVEKVLLLADSIKQDVEAIRAACGV